MRFRIDLKIFLFLLLFIVTKQIETYAWLMLFAVLHELGHLIAGVCLKLKPDKLEIIPLGVSISFKLTTKDFNKKIKRGNWLEVKKLIVAIAGPLTNGLIILVAYFLPIALVTKLMIVYTNLLIIFFNLLPIYPLDGGRIVKGILHIFLGLMVARKLTNEIAIISTIILTAVASIAILVYQNIAIFMIVMYLWFLVIKENRIYREREKLYERISSEETGNSVS